MALHLATSIIDRDTIDAQKWLDVVNTRLGIRNNADVRQKVINIFHIDILRADHAAQWAKLRHNWLRLRQSFDEQLTFICEKKTNIFLCWVVQGDPIVHLSAQYTKSPPSIRIAKLIHERAHTVLNISHATIQILLPSIRLLTMRTATSG